MRRCRRQGGDLMVLRCSDCNHSLKVPHSCGHRSCPHCQHHDSQRWIERQQAKLLPVEYFLITFTVPAELRALFWSQQRISYDLLLKTAWQTVDSSVAVRKDDAPAADQAAVTKVATVTPFFGGGGLIQTTSG
jgi:hypothetical protein